MNRRHFITLSGAAGLAAAAMPTQAAQSGGSERQYYELIQFMVEKEEQRKGLDKFFKEALIPAVNRLGIKQVGVFYPAEGLSPVHVLIPHPSMESVSTLMEQLSEDGDLLSNGAEFINAPASAPAFKRMESSVLVAFSGMPKLERPATNPERVFQLRIYESPSAKTNLKKIEMFNDAGEIKIFREVGLNPVFFGRALVGSKLPNLTYMLGFKSMDDQKAAWKAFGAHPDWQRLRQMPEYSDKAILSGITNLQLVPAEYSQI